MKKIIDFLLKNYLLHITWIVLIWLFSGNVFAHVITFYDREWRHDTWTVNRANSFNINIEWKNYNLSDSCEEVKYKNGYLYCKRENRWDFGAFVDTSNLWLKTDWNFPENVVVNVSESGSAHNAESYIDGTPITYMSNSSRKLNNIFAEEYLTKKQYEEKKAELEKIINLLKKDYALTSDLGDLSLLKKNTLLTNNWKILLWDIVNYDLIDMDLENVYTVCNRGCDYNLENDNSTNISSALNNALESAKNWLVKNIKILPYLTKDWTKKAYTANSPIVVKWDDITLYAEKTDNLEISTLLPIEIIKWQGDNWRFKNIKLKINNNTNATWFVFDATRKTEIEDVEMSIGDWNTWIVMRWSKCINPDPTNNPNYCMEEREKNYNKEKVKFEDWMHNNKIISTKVIGTNNSTWFIIEDQNNFSIQNSRFEGANYINSTTNGKITNSYFSSGMLNQQNLLHISNSNYNLSLKNNSFLSGWKQAILISADKNKKYGIKNNSIEKIEIKDNQILNWAVWITVLNGDYEEWKTDPSIDTTLPLWWKDINILQNIFNGLSYNIVKIDTSLSEKPIENINIIQNIADKVWVIDWDWKTRTAFHITDRDFVDSKAETTQLWRVFYNNRIMWAEPKDELTGEESTALWGVFYFRPYHKWRNCFCNPSLSKTNKKWFIKQSKDYDFEDNYCSWTKGEFTDLTCPVPPPSLVVEESKLNEIMWISW